ARAHAGGRRRRDPRARGHARRPRGPDRDLSRVDVPRRQRALTPHGTSGHAIRASIRAIPPIETLAGRKNGTHANAAKRSVATRASAPPPGAPAGRPAMLTATPWRRPQTKSPVHARTGK